MFVERSIPCLLDSARNKVAFRDVCRVINYYSPDREVAAITARGLVCEGWNGLPGWLRSFELREAEEELKLHINVDASVTHHEVERTLWTLEKQLARPFIHAVRNFRTRVFCIGWHKTGTTSFTDALRILGLFAWHFAPWVIGCTSYRSDVSDCQVDFEGIAEYTAVSDLPVCALYKELDKAFPGSLFVMTIRELEEWTASVLAHVRTCTEATGCLHSIDRWAYGKGAIEEHEFRTRYLRHEQEVRDYFEGRDDLLVIDVTGRAPWPQLCRFLGLTEPNVVFPHLNRTAALRYG